MSIITKQVFTTTSGRVFDTLEEAQNHERIGLVAAFAKTALPHASLRSEQADDLASFINHHRDRLAILLAVELKATPRENTPAGHDDEQTAVFHDGQTPAERRENFVKLQRMFPDTVIAGKRPAPPQPSPAPDIDRELDDLKNRLEEGLSGLASAADRAA